MDTTDGKNIMKESIFSYIRPIDGVGNVVHKDGQVVVKVPTGCLIFYRRNFSYWRKYLS